MMNGLIRQSAAALMLLALAAGASYGQSIGGSQVSGFVRDSSGGALPGASVSMTKTDTAQVRTTVTGADGGFSLPGLPAGPYQLKVVLQGFTTYVQDGIVLQVGSNPQINATLGLGGVSEQVTVNADAVMVEARSTGVGQVIDQQRVTELPLNGRQATELILLSGLATPAPSADLQTNKNYPTATISVAGGSASGITYIMDGGSHNDPFNNLNLPTPMPDALQEFKVETSSLPARYGQHAAAAVNLITRSGTNSYRGVVFDFVRHYRFNEKNYFALTKDSLRRNQFGGTMGGPVVQNRLFFFGAYQGKVEKTNPTTAQRFVPTAAMRAGDFTTFASAACNNGTARTLKTPFVNNQVDPKSFSPAAMKLLAFVPVATDPCGVYQFGIPNDNDRGTVARKSGRQAHRYTEHLRALHVCRVRQPGRIYDGKNVLTLSRIGQHNIVHSAVFGHNWVMSSSRLNALHVTLSRTFNDRIMPSYFSPTDLGVNIYAPTKGYTNVSVSGTGFSIGTGGTNPGFFDGTSIQIADDMDIVKRSHELSVGFNWINTTDLTEFYRFTNAENSFNGTILGLPLADFMMGKNSGFNQSPPSRTNQLLNYVAVYAQDTWRLRPDLTLNYGLRWEPFLPMSNRDNLVYLFDMNRFDAATKSQVFPNAPAGLYFSGDEGYPRRAVTSRKWAQFAPRIGTVWQPTTSTSVRAGWGTFYDTSHLFFNIGYQGLGQGTNITNPPGGFDNPYQDYPGGNPYPAALEMTAASKFNLFSGYATYPLHVEPTALQQWNVSVQQQKGDWLFAATYLGSHTSHLWGGRALNPAVYGPGATTGNTNARRVLLAKNPVEGQLIGALATLDDTGTADYKGMLLSVQRRLRSNLSVLSNWTFSKCESDQTDTQFSSGTTTTVPDHPEYDRGPCNSDRRHVVNLSAVARTPAFQDGGIAGLIARNWQFSPIIRWQSGSWSTPATGVDSALTGQPNQRALQILDNPYGDKTPGNYLNPASPSPRRREAPTAPCVPGRSRIRRRSQTTWRSRGSSNSLTGVGSRSAGRSSTSSITSTMVRRLLR